MVGQLLEAPRQRRCQAAPVTHAASAYTQVSSTFTLKAANTYGWGLVSSNREGTKRYFHFDGLGNTMALTDSSEVVQDTYVWTAFGLLASSSGSSVNPYRYVGQWGYYDDGAMGSPHGFLLLGVRYYAPEYGRFLTWDPIGVRGYGYCGNAAPMAIDPQGLTPAAAQGVLTTRQDQCHDCFDRLRKETDQYLLKKFKLRTNNNGRGNALGHCIVACKIRRRCPECSDAWNNREIMANDRECWLTIGHGQSQCDYHNNGIGYSLARGKEDCGPACFRRQESLCWNGHTGFIVHFLLFVTLSMSAFLASGCRPANRELAFVGRTLAEIRKDLPPATNIQAAITGLEEVDARDKGSFSFLCRLTSHPSTWFSGETKNGRVLWLQPSGVSEYPNPTVLRKVRKAVEGVTVEFLVESLAIRTYKTEEQHRLSDLHIDQGQLLVFSGLVFYYEGTIAVELFIVDGSCVAVRRREIIGY